MGFQSLAAKVDRNHPQVLVDRRDLLESRLDRVHRMRRLQQSRDVMTWWLGEELGARSSMSSMESARGR